MTFSFLSLMRFYVQIDKEHNILHDVAKSWWQLSDMIIILVDDQLQTPPHAYLTLMFKCWRSSQDLLPRRLTDDPRGFWFGTRCRFRGTSPTATSSKRLVTAVPYIAESAGSEAHASIRPIIPQGCSLDHPAVEACRDATRRTFIWMWLDMRSELELC